jgi:hypothetical protein
MAITFYFSTASYQEVVLKDNFCGYKCAKEFVISNIIQ